MLFENQKFILFIITAILLTLLGISPAVLTKIESQSTRNGEIILINNNNEYEDTVGQNPGSDLEIEAVALESTTRSSSATRGISKIWSDTFEGGTFLKWDSTPPAAEINYLSDSSINFGGQTTKSSSTGSLKFIQGRDNDNQSNYLKKTFTNLEDYSMIMLSFYWAEQDIELDEVCLVEVYDRDNGYQALKSIGSDNGNNDGIELVDWTFEQFKLYDLSSYGLKEIQDWSEIVIRFEWSDMLDSKGEPVDDQWFLDDVALWGDGHPSFVSGMVTPEIGDITDEFTFSVFYYDADNDEPFFVYIELNGVNYTMEEADLTDTTYTNGKEYIYKTYLDSDTTYYFSFWASDGLTIENSTIHYGPSVNRGPPVRIDVIAPKTEITSDETLQFDAQAYDEHDSEVEFEPEWDVNGGGYITTTGFFTASKTGSWLVYANYTGGTGTVSGTMKITITPGKLAELLIEPSIIDTLGVFTSDQIIKFNIIALDSDNNIVPSEGYDIKLSSNGGGKLYPNGTFDPVIKGFWMVFANVTIESKLISAKYSFQIQPGAIQRLEITPSEPIIRAGELVTFTAEVFDRDNNSFKPGTLPWSTTGGGTIDNAGKFEATTIGNYIIKVVYINRNNESIEGSQRITVELGEIQQIKVFPNEKILNAGESINVYARGFDGFGNSKIIVPDWHLSGSGEFDITQGVFKATSGGISILYANHSGASGQAVFYINHLRVERIDIGPGESLMVIGETIKFDAKGFDSEGASVFMDITWSVSGGGVIDENGSFNAKQLGEWIIFAEYDGKTGETTVIVNQFILERIEITPSKITLKVNQVQHFTAVGFAEDGEEVKINPEWLLVGTKTTAEIDQNGTFSASVIGTWKIRAVTQGISGSAEVTVISDHGGAGTGSTTDDKASSEETLYFSIIIILLIIIVLSVFLTWYRIKRKLTRDKEEMVYLEEREESFDRYTDLYGGDESISSGSFPGRISGDTLYGGERQSNSSFEPPAAPKHGKVRQLQVTRRTKIARQKPADSSAPPGGSRPVSGPMRYGYIPKRDVNKNSLKEAPGVAVDRDEAAVAELERKKPSKRKANKKSAGEDKHRIEWD